MKRFRSLIITDPFTLSHRLFVKNFRLTKDVVRDLINLLKPHIVSNHIRSSAIDLNTKVFITLNFLATGSYQSPIGNSRFMALSQPTVSLCISEVVAALNLPEIFNVWVKFPKDINELTDIRNGFYRDTGFPGVIGSCIYINRKGYYSINVQLICDSKLKILNVNALFPGSTHDIHVWNNSSVLPILQELYRRNYNDFYLLGDSGYPLRQWLLTPISNPSTEAEEYYNKRQMSTRSVIERCNGVLKVRFRCLLKDRTLHYKPEKASSIINACIVLHNMCISNNIELVDEPDVRGLDDLGMIENEDTLADLNVRNIELGLGRHQRNNVIRYLSHRNVQ
ncbi:unnamed protein product [Macrosiphum euphorbiae]|uniref:DDE Tnp4 domain-containing protein n=1 Tax=Macrosiphum euphorbiae TaxID=13131 RepID=A0AAV0W9X8_9HEMI|nr:unnamed protein product [Macrosiphum euphorbiae]